MKPRHALPLVLYVLLFLRQKKVERQLAAAWQDYTTGCNSVIEESFKGWNRWGESLVKQVERVMEKTGGQS